MHLWVLGREEVLLKPQAAGSPSSKEDLSCSQYEIYFALPAHEEQIWKLKGPEDPGSQLAPHPAPPGLSSCIRTGSAELQETQGGVPPWSLWTVAPKAPNTCDYLTPTPALCCKGCFLIGLSRELHKSDVFIHLFNPSAEQTI
ncbi:hypothetical protein CB1_000475009 [Camelus ferus]|nr:hypothetical protein CB1_000475009 [Camelus ferus]